MRLAGSNIHFIGIGGVGMCGLAELLYRMGANVTGSDLNINSNARKLIKMGIQVYEGHSPDNLYEPDVLVFSSAVPENNPELVYARENKIPIIPRAEVLAEIMQLKRGIGVGGTHGKTTTTSLISSVLLAGNMEPTIFVGGILESIKSTALLGTGEWLVAEADESDGSFLKLRPETVVITNIDYDHMNYYKTEENLLYNFRQFALKIPFYGQVIACGDDRLVRAALKNFPKRVIYYGFNTDNDFSISGQNSDYIVQRDGKVLGELQLKLPGRHNALNSLAALIVGINCGLSFEACKQALVEFSGVGRRMEFLGEFDGAKFFDDYAHHPTEIKASLQAFREKFPSSKIAVVFQPHRITRTQECWEGFCVSFKDCDSLWLTDIYTAGEDSIEGVDSNHLAQDISHENVTYLGRLESAIDFIKCNASKFDIVVSLGAGSISKAGRQIVNGNS